MAEEFDVQLTKICKYVCDGAQWHLEQGPLPPLGYECLEFLPGTCDNPGTTRFEYPVPIIPPLNAIDSDEA